MTKKDIKVISMIRITHTLWTGPTYPVIVGWVGRDIYSLADRFLLPSPGAPLVHIVTLPTALIANPWSRSGCRVPLVAALSLGHVGLGTVDRLDVLSQGTGVGVALGASSDLACIWFLWLRKEQSHRIYMSPWYLTWMGRGTRPPNNWTRGGL